MKTKILFVCTANKDRSPTAAALYRDRPYLEVKSAGTSEYAKTPLTDELLAWADIILVMERAHEAYIRENFPASAEKKIHCLKIKDKYRYGDSNLIRKIEERMSQLKLSE